MTFRLPALAIAVLVVSVSGVSAAVWADDGTAPRAESVAMAAPPAQLLEAAPAPTTTVQGATGELPGSGSPNIIMPLALVALLASFLTSANGRRLAQAAFALPAIAAAGSSIRRSARGRSVRRSMSNYLDVVLTDLGALSIKPAWAMASTPAILPADHSR
jgi:hypothetical protein